MTSLSNPYAGTLAETPPLPRIARPSIAIIGLGRAGSVLSRALHAAGYRICVVSSRDPIKAQAIAVGLNAQVGTPLEAACAADLTFLTISDDASESVAHKLAAAGAWHAGQYAVHASGALPASVLAPAAECGATIGSFHPLAAFARHDATLPAGIAFGIEAREPLRTVLHEMARALGGYPLDLRADQKALYHAAAVIASNYTVTLAALATEIFEQLGVTLEQGLQALLPLMHSTLDNLEQQGLPGALTGPIVRGDAGTVRQHLLALDRPTSHIGAFYRCLAQATLPLAQQHGLQVDVAGTIRDLITLPGELIVDS